MGKKRQKKNNNKYKITSKIDTSLQETSAVIEEISISPSDNIVQAPDQNSPPNQNILLSNDSPLIHAIIDSLQSLVQRSLSLTERISSVKNSENINSLTDICNILHNDMNCILPNVVDLARCAQKEHRRITDFINQNIHSHKNSNSVISNTKMAETQTETINPEIIPAFPIDKNISHASESKNIKIIRCFNCQMYMHYANSCVNKYYCPWCSSTHAKTSKCNRPPRCINCCRQNRRYKQKLPENHPAFDTECPTLKIYTSKP